MPRGVLHAAGRRAPARCRDLGPGRGGPRAEDAEIRAVKLHLLRAPTQPSEVHSAVWVLSEAGQSTGDSSVGWLGCSAQVAPR